MKVDAHSDFVRKVFKLVKIITQLEKSRPTQQQKLSVSKTVDPLVTMFRQLGLIPELQAKQLNVIHERKHQVDRSQEPSHRKANSQMSNLSRNRNWDPNSTNRSNFRASSQKCVTLSGISQNDSNGQSKLLQPKESRKFIDQRFKQTMFSTQFKGAKSNESFLMSQNSV